MSSATDPKSKLRSELVRDIYSVETIDFGGYSQRDAESVADVLIAAGWVKPEAAWVESLENDGTYEYTSSSHCDGTHIAHWRRKPGKTYQADPEPWEHYEPETL